MKKLKVVWNIDPRQDIDAVTSPKSPFYEEQLTKEFEQKFGESFKEEMVKHLMKTLRQKKILKKWKESGLLNGLTLLDATSSIKLFEANPIQKISEFN